MIDDKTAKMAINTIAAYCVLHINCNNCKIMNNCLGVECVAKPFGSLHSYPYINIFEKTCHNANEKTPKFDIRQKDSVAFRNYINKIFMEEAEKYGLPMNTANSIKWTARGTIVVTFVDDDNKTNYIGVAKCHPDDAFNPEIGIKLAIERAAQNMRKPFIPREGQAYCYVDANGVVRGTGFLGSIESKLNVAMGNCFKTRAQAQANAGIMMKRLERATELLKTLREDDVIHQ
ncbi:MAG: DUF1876 domain-containing protein [Megasphaera elsdenii]|nr:DUF1876 domain-containing protein [Megasphaera elsdenii]